MTELDLGLQLEMFAQSNLKTREKVLPGLLAGVKSYLTPETIDGMLFTETNEAPRTVYSILESPFAEAATDDGQVIYTGEGAAVIISSDGHLTGWFENSTGPVHKEHGLGVDKSLLTFAMIKAIRRLHIELVSDSKYSGGIVARSNYDYLRDLTPDIPIFEGDAIRNQGEGATKKFAAVVGVSGAFAKEEFLKELTGGTVMSHTNDMFAGMMDTIAACAIADVLTTGKKSPYTIPERAAFMLRSH